MNDDVRSEGMKAMVQYELDLGTPAADIILDPENDYKNIRLRNITPEDEFLGIAKRKLLPLMNEIMDPSAPKELDVKDQRSELLSLLKSFKLSSAQDAEPASDSDKTADSQ